MLYPFLTLEDGTTFSHKGKLEDGRYEIVIERDGDGYAHAHCHIPFDGWDEVSGFDDGELELLRRSLDLHSHVVEL